MLLFLVFSTNGIAQRLPPEDEPLRFHQGYSENGLIFGSISFPMQKLNYDGAFLQIDYISDDKKERRKNSCKIKIGPTMFKGKHNGELDGGRTYLFVMEKKPGSYTIDWLRFTILKVGDYNGIEKDVAGFYIPFDVKKGEITYIGNITIDEYAPLSNSIINISDQFEKDKNAMKEMQKMVNWDASIKSELKINR